MPETFDLDRAFEALTRDVMARPTPPSDAPIKRARRRRRTTIALAAASVLAVAGVAVPTLAGERLGMGFADGVPDAAPFNAAALNDVTEGWIEGWSDDSSGAGSFSVPRCQTYSDDDGEAAVHSGVSHFYGSERSSVSFSYLTFPDSASADRSWQASIAPLTECTTEGAETSAPDYPVGTDVRHFTVLAAPESQAALTDVWVARTGTVVGTVELATSGSGAAADVIDAMSDALVAGLLDGTAQKESNPQSYPDIVSRGQLPSFYESDFDQALDGWRNAGRVDATTLPLTPCLAALTGGVGSTTGATPQGNAFDIVGYLQPGAEARQQIADAVARLRSCRSTAMTEQSLAGGVTLFTFDVGGPAGHGAVWLGANDDRAMVYTVDGASTPLPEGAGARVGKVLSSVLDLPWAPAE